MKLQVIDLNKKKKKTEPRSMSLPSRHPATKRVMNILKDYLHDQDKGI